MGIQEMMARELAGYGAKLTHGEWYGDIKPDIQWIRWLSYEPEFEKKKRVELENKLSKDLSNKELKELNIYIKRDRILKLFKIYGTKEISKDEALKVYEYMKKEDIELLMIDKLTKEELEYAKVEIERLCSISEEELREKVNTESKLDNYNKLSMVDAYILHIIQRTDYARAMRNLNEKLQAELEANRFMRTKSYLHANMRCCK